LGEALFQKVTIFLSNFLAALGIVLWFSLRTARSIYESLANVLLPKEFVATHFRRLNQVRVKKAAPIHSINEIDRLLLNLPRDSCDDFLNLQNSLEDLDIKSPDQVNLTLVTPQFPNLQDSARRFEKHFTLPYNY
jgi:hypothetical protein